MFTVIALKEQTDIEMINILEQIEVELTKNATIFKYGLIIFWSVVLVLWVIFLLIYFMK